MVLVCATQLSLTNSNAVIWSYVQLLLSNAENIFSLNLLGVSRKLQLHVLSYAWMFIEYVDAAWCC